jgi:hypothetical protein
MNNSSNHREKSLFGKLLKVCQFSNILIEEKYGSLEISHEKSEKVKHFMIILYIN